MNIIAVCTEQKLLPPAPMLSISNLCKIANESQSNRRSLQNKTKHPNQFMGRGREEPPFWPIILFLSGFTPPRSWSRNEFFIPWHGTFYPYSSENKSLGHAGEEWLQKAIKNSSYHLSGAIIILGVQAMLYPHQYIYFYCMLCIKRTKVWSKWCSQSLIYCLRKSNIR